MRLLELQNPCKWEASMGRRFWKVGYDEGPHNRPKDILDLTTIYDSTHKTSRKPCQRYCMK